MKILIVNYYNYPMSVAHAYRWSEIAKYWVKRGWQVDYICSRYSCEKNKYNVITAGVRLYGTGVVGVIRSKSKGGENNKTIDSFIGKVKKCYRAVFWPDGLWHWLPFVAWEIFKSRREAYDAVISYSPTYSAHMSVLFRKKFCKNNFIWIADYGDPFSISESMPPNNFKIYHKLNLAIEKKVISACNFIVFTNKLTKQAYEEKYLCSDKAQLIHHMVNLERFYSDSFRPAKKRLFNFVYIGSLHRGIREPYLAVKVVCLLAKLLEQHGIQLSVDFYGSANGIDVSGLGSEVINWRGAIDRSQAITVMKRADFLINIENINCIMTPSKIVEYIATGRPIINIVEQNKTELLDMYEKTGWCHSVSCLDDMDELMEFVKKKGGNIAEYKLVSDFLNENSLSCVAKKYEKLIGVR